MKRFKFIDLFAGIGGFRLALEKVGGECVFSCEIDEHAQLMYQENFGDIPFPDITQLNAKNIPDFDVLCAGFPCQSFSVAGYQKGFEDATRGTLFFDICRILKTKRPKVFLLENVKNLATHDKGNTLFIMLKALAEIGYSTSYHVLNAKDFGVPQNRERIVIVGSSEGKVFDFSLLNLTKINSMKNYLDNNIEEECLKTDTYTLIDKKYIKRQKSDLIFVGYRNKRIRTAGVRPGTEHLSRVHKQPNRIYSTDGVHPTIASQEVSGRYFIYDGSCVRKLTLNECYKFMGFPDSFKKIGSLSKLYERIGNSVCVSMVEEIMKQVISQFHQKSPTTANITEYLEALYQKSLEIKNITCLELTEEQLNHIDNIVAKEETFKGVYTVLITSLVYKSLYPQQDVRRHQANMKNGYSGRTFDTKYITPFLKTKRFAAAMKESGWLTRSLEQNLPYDLNYPGKINNFTVKTAFLSILNDIEHNSCETLAEKYLLACFKKSLEQKEKKALVLINPIKTESTYPIEDIINLLHRHFYYPYKSRGASILPVIALYSVYECMIKELKRFDGKVLDKLASHYSSDKSSGSTGDIVIRNQDNHEIYESIEIKFDISVNLLMLHDAYKKIINHNIQRYYVLSTKPMLETEIPLVQHFIQTIKNEQGCPVIVNGVFPTLKYYLRLLENTDNFMNNYVKNLENHTEINFEHKLAWNELTQEDNPSSITSSFM